MNGYKENCVYNNLRIGIALYLILNFITGNIYYFFFMFKITNLFKYVDSLQDTYKKTRACVIFMLVSAIVMTVAAIGFVAAIFIMLEDIFYYFSILQLEIVLYSFIVLGIVNSVVGIYWAYKIRSAIRQYNLETYGINYTANGFFTFFCPGIVFIWAIENTPVEARLRKMKKGV